MNLARLLTDSINELSDFYRIAKPFYFDDGKYFISVQASAYHYCLPKRNLPYDDYTHFEVFARIPDEDIPQDWKIKFKENKELYPYVPKDDIVKLLSKLDDKYKILPNVKEDNH